MSNPNEHIEDFLKYYFKLKNSPHYAVLLKGKWGVGKTWFLKEVMESLYNSDYRVKTHLYVSLYGIASFEEIENEFFRQLHPVLSSKGMALAGKIGKGLLKTTLKIDLNNDGKSDASVVSQVPDINLPDYLSNTEGLILVFDDLERSSMNLENLLGYINYFVEHQGYKVIIIANEEELFDTKEKNDGSYKRIKEKLIGKTFEVQPRLESAINNFINEIENVTTQELFNNNLELIKDYYQRSGYLNLRHLRQALMDFARLVDIISSEIREKYGIIEELLSVYLMLSFEVKSGEMLPVNISELEDLYINELSYKSSSKGSLEEEVDSFYTNLRKKYPTFDPFDMLLEKSVWFDIFDKGLIDNEKVQESLRNSRYFHSENQPEWMQLWHFMFLEDSNFDSLLSIVKDQFRNKKYEQLGEIKHVTGLFLELVDQDLLDKTKEEVLELAKNNINNLIAKGQEIPHFDYVNIYDDTQTFGLEFRNKNDTIFIKLLEYITEVSKKQVLDSLPKIGKDLLEDIKNNSDNFHKKIYYTGSMNNYNKYPVLRYIKPNDFVEAVIGVSPYERRGIILTISSRYKLSREVEVLLPEIAWLQEVTHLMINQAEQRKGKISSFQIERFTNTYLVSAINILHQVSPNPKQASNYCWSPSQYYVGVLQTTAHMKTLGINFNFEC